MAVENRIRKFREDKGWSEEALALALRTEAKQVQRWEKNMLQRVLHRRHFHLGAAVMVRLRPE